MRAQLCQLMQKSSALPKEVSSCKSSALPAHAGELSSVSSCRRAQHYPKRSAHAGAQLCQLMQESSALSAHAEELSTAQRGQLMQESSALTKEVSSTLHKRSAHVGELNSDQRG